MDPQQSGDPLAKDRRPLRVNAPLISAVVMVVVWAIAHALSLQTGSEKSPTLEALHDVLELLSIIAAFLVFATVWHTPSREVEKPALLIGAAIFVAGCLDFFHTSSLDELSAFAALTSTEAGLALRILARLLVTFTLLAITFDLSALRPDRWNRLNVLMSYLFINGLFLSAVLVYPTQPSPPTGGDGFWSRAALLQLLIVALLLLAAWRHWQQQTSQPSGELHRWLFSACIAAALSEVLLLNYALTTPVQNLVGHVFKLIAYAYLYRAMLVRSILQPYQRLQEQTQDLIRLNLTLRTQALALDSTATPALVTDLNGHVRWRNRASRAIWSDNRADGLCLFTPPLTPDPVIAQQTQSTLEAGQIWKGLVSTQDDQGHEIILNRTVTPLRNEQKAVEGYVIVSENVTDSIHAQSRYQRILETALDGFMVLDSKGGILEVNPAYARMTGYTVDELSTMHINDLRYTVDRDRTKQLIGTLLEKGHDEFETRHRHKDGHEISVDISATYDQTTHQFYVFVRDRTERVQAGLIKRDLERQLQQAQKLQEVGQLTSGIAHDFNNILAAILGYSNLALNRFAPDKGGKLASYLREIIVAGERARDLIAKLLSFARTQPNADTGWISAAATIEEVMSMLKPSMPSSIRLETRIEDHQKIKMDAGELAQVLVNLIINARDAIDGHGTISIHLHRITATGQISAITQERLFGPFLALEVADTGSGIAPENIPKLFAPFFTTKDVGKGTGLGLSVVQGILRRAQAHILVQSQPGQGSQFQILFPLLRPGSLVPEQPDTVQESAPTGKGQVIWVLDDEPSIARYLCDLLEETGYRVKMFIHPGDLLNELEIHSQPPDLLITDQTMPAMTGTELALRLQSDAPGLPVILCTGNPQALERTPDLEARVSQYLTKPVAPPALLAAIGRALDQSR